MLAGTVGRLQLLSRRFNHIPRVGSKDAIALVEIRISWSGVGNFAIIWLVSMRMQFIICNYTRSSWKRDERFSCYAGVSCTDVAYPCKKPVTPCTVHVHRSSNMMAWIVVGLVVYQAAPIALGHLVALALHLIIRRDLYDFSCQNLLLFGCWASTVDADVPKTCMP
jgi:hypothetical protein